MVETIVKIKFIDAPPVPVSWEPWVKEVLLLVKEVSAVQKSPEEYSVRFSDLLMAIEKVSRATGQWLRTWKSNQPGSTIDFPRNVCEEIVLLSPPSRMHDNCHGGGRSG